MIALGDLAVIVGTSLIVAVVISAIAVMVLHLLRRASILIRLGVVVLAAVASIVGGTVAIARAMYISSHDFVVLAWVIGVAAVASLGVAAVLGMGLVRTSRTLRVAARAVGDGQVVPAERQDSSEFSALSRELADVSRRLAESREEVRMLDESRRELVAWISHDLRTPLAAMQAMAEALEDGIAADPERYYRQLRSQTDTLSHMVDDLFELSKIQSGALRLELGPLSMYDLVSDAVADLAPLAATRSVSLNESQDGDLTVWGDARELSRVIHNLLVNAIEHSPAGSAIHVSVREGAHSSVVLSVVDEGGGIPEEYLPKVFDAGWRGSAARSPRSGVVSGGAGLGLAIVHGIVTAHDGDVSVRNTVGGCRFDVRLPRFQPRMAGS
ncbi:His Kinase A (phospho-acceptor) domain-containing protein [Leifsonia sp. 98AMF]|uniref:sensor histidine kinase n=1 Tax=unclassified Leifsonia TaxID=2663824 RepID=UPI00087A985F|nr:MULTISPECIES: HAMP domain-containing sensor histidine kinase [unclassified Leifsonia]SDH72577.1 His Kinase A (phospho-acceptor) domain-containing protein [Leifsonia sp. 197AMF]SDJ49409.1 His Kinase A (phospho-acceptor) domain-containing protein [Leifsonia sp. 466MF]SDK25282.1 His Kinase A (phospho-acceptor) domain-containing protein [Leifsonia sp. 157MF]SDN69308.1 His Kinase A (phospho-acceptor) domain-containing protein [Leifsonia sp. 509MF]SEN38881.1 His Kinase A (phospho-acceptor) domain